jgi:hypothetical protein
MCENALAVADSAAPEWQMLRGRNEVETLATHTRRASLGTRRIARAHAKAGLLPIDTHAPVTGNQPDPGREKSTDIDRSTHLSNKACGAALNRIELHSFHVGVRAATS